jgi:hypothetical protein
VNVNITISKHHRDTWFYLKAYLLIFSDTGSNVAFTAGAFAQKYTPGQSVIFSNVIYQVGLGYSPTTGVFTAPRAGLYFIFCTVVAYDHQTFWAKIMINGSEKVGVMAFTDISESVYPSASNLVVHHLQMWDRVWIQYTVQWACWFPRLNFLSYFDQWFRLTVIATYIR